MLAARAPNGIAQGRAIDPLNPSGDSNIDWSVDSMLALKSETSTSLHWRFDFQLMTSNVYHGVPGGLALVPGTYHIFGNNGTTPYHGSVNSTSNTALNASLAPGATVTAAALYQDLTTASDHLPVVADYTIPLSPLVASFTASPTNGPAPLAVTFTDTSTGNVTNRFWTFGDGGATNVTTNVVRHTYNAAGSYGVVETVRGTGGSSTNTQSKCITVRTPF
jgi:PKD repeat protein